MLTIPVNGLGLALRDFYRDWKILISQSCKIRANNLPCFHLKSSQCLIVGNHTTIGNRRSSLRVAKCNTYVANIHIMIHVADIHNRSEPTSCCNIDWSSFHFQNSRNHSAGKRRFMHESILLLILLTDPMLIFSTGQTLLDGNIFLRQHIRLQKPCIILITAANWYQPNQI